METGKGRKHATSKGAPRQSCFLMQNAQNFFFIYLQKNNAIIINPNEDTQLAATFSKRFGGAGIYKPTAGTEPRQAAAGVSALPSLLTQRNKGVMIRDQQHAKVKQENGTK